MVLDSKIKIKIGDGLVQIKKVIEPIMIVQFGLTQFLSKTKPTPISLYLFTTAFMTFQ